MRTILLGAGLALLSVTAANAIDCKKASDPLDLAICNSPEALKADDAMNAAYQAASKLSTPKDAKALKADQVNWLDLRSDCQYGVDAEGNGTDATREQTAQCLVDYYGKRTAFLSGTPAEGPGAPGQMVPVVFSGVDEIFGHTLRFRKPATPGEIAYNTALDTELKDIHVATKDGDNSDTFDLTLAYASPALLSANVDVYLDGARFAHPMPLNFSINIDMAKGKRLIMSDMLDDSALKTIAAACEGQTKDFIGDGEGADTRLSDVETMVEHIDHWTFGAGRATLRYLDYDTQDAPVECSVGYDMLKPLVKAGFPLPQ